MVYPLAEMQKAYGREIDAKLVMQGWQLVLADKYNGDQICYALKQYALSGGDDFPSPKNLEDILNPEAPRITTAEYVQACQTHERNHFPMYSAESRIIADYKKQREEERVDYEIECDTVKQIAGDSLQRMTGASLPQTAHEPKKQITSELREKAIETQRMPWDNMVFETMPDDVKAEFIQFCKDFPSNHIAEIYCRSYECDYNQIVGGDT